MAATSLRACWNAITAWSPARAKTEMQRFADRQPVVVACVTAYLEEEGTDAGGQALMLALALDGYYAGLLGRAPAQIKERALDEAERGFAELAGVEPALALRRMLARREAAPGEARQARETAMRWKLRAADAMYVWVAEREGVPLCTLDDELERRAGGACTIVSP